MFSTVCLPFPLNSFTRFPLSLLLFSLRRAYFKLFVVHYLCWTSLRLLYSTTSRNTVTRVPNKKPKQYSCFFPSFPNLLLEIPPPNVQTRSRFSNCAAVGLSGLLCCAKFCIRLHRSICLLCVTFVASPIFIYRTHISWSCSRQCPVGKSRFSIFAFCAFLVKIWGRERLLALHHHPFFYRSANANLPESIA